MFTVGFVAKAPPTDGVVFSARPGVVLSPSAAGSPDSVLLARALAGKHRFRGEEGDVFPIMTADGWRILLGLDAIDQQSAARLRRAGGALYAEVAALGPEKLTLQLDLSPPDAAEVLYGMILRAWRPDPRYRSKPDPEDEIALTAVTVVTDEPAVAQARFDRLAAVASASAFTRDLVVAPANELTPDRFVKRLRGLESFGITIDIVDPAHAGLNLLAAVGQGSAQAPKLVILRWQGGREADRPVAFVGKGITFDTGGIDIKPRLHMEEMKGDMAGAGAVAGVLQALAARRASVNAVGVLAIAENMPSGRATRPGDVVRGCNGMTVEIIDTDAEGRLVLADALAYTAINFRPRWMIDLATLTGAVEVTLGYHRAGLFTDDDSLAAQLFAAGEAEDEKLWRLPLTDFYDAALKSEVADLRNCTWDRGPDALHAARFLQNFVPPGLPWAHLDIAGMSEAAEDKPLAAEGPTGFGVRLLDRLVADHVEGA